MPYCCAIVISPTSASETPGRAASRTKTADREMTRRFMPISSIFEVTLGRVLRERVAARASSRVGPGPATDANPEIDRAARSRHRVRRAEVEEAHDHGVCSETERLPDFRIIRSRARTPHAAQAEGVRREQDIVGGNTGGDHL